MRKIGFVILTWNSEKYIANCIRAIYQVDEGHFLSTIVVVDNGSTDRTVAAMENERGRHSGSPHRLEVVRLKRNEGTTHSRNLGLRRLFELEPELEWVCMLDSDAEISQAALEAMVDASLRDPRIGIIGPRMHGADGVYQTSGKDFSTVSCKIRKVMPIRSWRERGERMETMTSPRGSGCVAVGYLMSACWVMRREVLDLLGPLDEKIFYAPEDLEYCIRCWKRGYRVVYCYDADILHLWQRLSRKKLFSRLNYEHICGLIHVFVRYRYAFSSKKLWRDIPAELR